MLFYAACDLQAFKLFDTDGDGIITTTELKELVAKVGHSSMFFQLNLEKSANLSLALY